MSAWVVTGAGSLLILAGALAEVVGRRPETPAEGRDYLLAVLCLPLGLRVIVHAPRNACGWLLLATGGFAAGTVGSSAVADGVIGWFRDWLWWPSFGLLLLAALVFPDGRLIGRGWRWLAVLLGMSIGGGAIALAVIAMRVPEALPGGATDTSRRGWEFSLLAAAIVGLLVAAVGTVAAIGVRLRRVPRAGRGPLIWAFGNAALLLIALVLDAVEGLPVVWLGATAAIPVAVTVGVLRYGLYDISLLVHRSLLYGLLTVGMLLVYTAAVAGAAWMAPSMAAPVAAGVTVVALLPARQAAQAALDRLLYGQRSRPYEMITSLSRRMGSADTPERTLSSAVTAVGEQLKLPYVSIELANSPRPAATYGRQRTWAVTTMPLIYRSRQIGRLLVQQRAPDELWSRSEQALLTDLAEQLGPPTAAVRLARDLQEARERLVRSREEELRRLQRELHDGIGPSLAGARMLARAAQAGGTQSHGRLDDVESTLADAAVELRRIIDGLRPPALDRGLPAALEVVLRRHRAAGVDVKLSTGGDLSRLPAAIEVAAYRVIDEALTNVNRHADATKVRVSLVRARGHLRIVVNDNGVGGVTSHTDGIGLGSMRERCQELGGHLEVVPSTRGTGVVASIPID